MRPPKVAFIAPREESRTRNDAVSLVSESLVTRLTSRGTMKATLGGHVRTTLSNPSARTRSPAFGNAGLLNFIVSRDRDEPVTTIVCRESGPRELRQKTALAEDRVQAGTRLLAVPNLAAVLPLLAANLASPFTRLLDTH